MESGELKTGYLDVKPPAQYRAFRKKAWKRRWVVLQRIADLSDSRPMAKMAFYSSSSAWEGGQPDKHILYLDGLMAIPRTKSRSHGHAFQLWQQGQPLVTLAGQSETETQGWLAMLRDIFWPGTSQPPADHRAMFPVSLIDNDYSSALGLSGTFWMTVDSNAISLSSCQQAWTWDLVTIARFYQGKTISPADRNKILVIVTAKCSQGGAGMFYFFTSDADAILQAIYSSVAAAMKQLCFQGAQRESAVDIWFSDPERRWSVTTDSGSEEAFMLDPDNPLPGPDPLQNFSDFGKTSHSSTSDNEEFSKEKDAGLPPYNIPSSEKEALISANKAKVLFKLSLMAGVGRHRSMSTDSSSSVSKGHTPVLPIRQYSPNTMSDTTTGKLCYVPAMPPADIGVVKERTTSNSSIASQVSSLGSKDSGFVSSATRRRTSTRLDDFKDIPEDNSEPLDIPTISITHEFGNEDSPSHHRSLPEIQIGDGNELSGRSSPRLRSLSSVNSSTSTETTVPVCSSPMSPPCELLPTAMPRKEARTPAKQELWNSSDSAEINSSSSSSCENIPQELKPTDLPKTAESRKVDDNPLRKISTTSHIYLEIDGIVEQHSLKLDHQDGLIPDEISAGQLKSRQRSCSSDDHEEELGQRKPIFRKSLYKFFGESVQDMDAGSQSPQLMHADIPPPLPQRPKSLPPIDRPRQRKKGIFGSLVRQRKSKRDSTKRWSLFDSTSSEDESVKNNSHFYLLPKDITDSKNDSNQINASVDYISTTSESDDQDSQLHTRQIETKDMQAPFPDLIQPVSQTYGPAISNSSNTYARDHFPLMGRFRSNTDIPQEVKCKNPMGQRHQRCRSMDLSPLHETTVMSSKSTLGSRDAGLSILGTKIDYSEEFGSDASNLHIDTDLSVENLSLNCFETPPENDDTYLTMSNLVEPENEGEMSETYMDMTFLKELLTEDSEV